MSWRRRKLPALLLAGVLAVGTAGAVATAAEPVAGQAPSAEFMARQKTLMEFKSWLIGQPGIYDSGFVASANYAETTGTTLLWAGSSPLQDIARVEGAKRGIKVTVRPVKYSRADVDRAMAALWASAKSPRWNGFVITGLAGTDLTHDGIVVDGHYDGIGDAEARGRLTAAVGLARSVAPEVVDVRIVPAPVAATTRSTDTAPLNSGGMMVGLTGRGCTSGFAIWLDGYARTTTARHCQDGPYAAWDLASSYYGGNIRWAHGTGAQVLAGAGHSWMFDGAWNDPTGFHKTVVGFADLSINDWIWTSGAMSGMHQSIVVANLLYDWNDGYGSFHTIWGAQTGGGVAASTGDSGGPVMVAYPDANWTTVGAAGMIQWVGGSVGCGSTRVSGVLCSNVVGFTSMHAIVNELGATLRTG
ncbi:hypothetical protein GCM10029964_099680 [Kibdelosporangium lantanae]